MLAIIFAPFYILVNVYLARWVLRWTGACHRLFGSKPFRVLFIAVYSFVVLTPLTGFLVQSPAWLRRILKQIGNYWFGWLLYLILAVAVTELILALVRVFRKKDFEGMQRVRQVQGGAALALVCVLGFYGMAHAKTLYVTEFDAAVDKAGEDMTVALLADLHLGYSTDPAYIEEAAAAVSAMQPDLVVIAGDIFDNEFDAVPAPDRVAAALASMRSKYGTFACWGNHDLSEPILAGFTWFGAGKDKTDPRMERFLAEAGVTLLDDQTVQLANGAYLIGRKDPSRDKKLGDTRKNPVQLTENLDKTKPILLIDHQPKQLDELADCGVDLGLSGHTHDGQLFPGNLTIRLLWRNACGYLKVNGMHSVVTSGVGVWGPDLRVGTKSEVVRVNLHCTG